MGGQPIRLASLLVLALPSAARAQQSSDSLNLTTAYPSPMASYGYVNVHATQYIYPYLMANEGSNGTCVYNKSDAAIAAPCLTSTQKVPQAGQVFYNGDMDALYYASNKADPNDQSTWYKSVSGINAGSVGSMTIGSFAETSTWWYKNYNVWWKYQWVYGWTPGPETGIKLYYPTAPWYLKNFDLRVPSSKAAGLYAVEASGVYCTSYTVALQNVVAAGDTPQGQPSFILYRGLLGVAFAAIAVGTLSVDLVNVSGSYICGNFDIAAMQMLPRGSTSNDYGLQFQADIHSDDCIYNNTFDPCPTPTALAEGKIPDYSHGYQLWIPNRPEPPATRAQCLAGGYTKFNLPCSLDYISNVTLQVSRLLTF